MHEIYMEEALKLAEEGRGRVHPNPMVGALLVKDGKILGRGRHRKAGGAHAETEALEEAGEEARGAVLYVTLEPCAHRGKTPPCTEALIKAGISRCVCATEDPNPLVQGRGIRLLKNAGIDVLVGVREKEARELNRIFFHYIRQKTPYVFLKAAMTLDGKIAARSGRSRWISSEESRKRVHYLRHCHTGIMVGIGTALSDDPALNCRLYPGGEDPVRIILDPSLRIDEGLGLVRNNQDGKTLILTEEKHRDTDRYRRLSEKIRLIPVSGSAPWPWENILEVAGRAGVDSLLVEGGSSLFSSLFREGLYNEGELFVAPLFLGDSRAVPFLEGFSPSCISEGLFLPRAEFFLEGKDIRIHFSKESA